MDYSLRHTRCFLAERSACWGDMTRIRRAYHKLRKSGSQAPRESLVPGRAITYPYCTSRPMQIVFTMTSDSWRCTFANGGKLDDSCRQDRLLSFIPYEKRSAAVPVAGSYLAQRFHIYTRAPLGGSAPLQRPMLTSEMQPALSKVPSPI